jgi:hypothetical protein
VTAPSYPTTRGTTAATDSVVDDGYFILGAVAGIPLVPIGPEYLNHDSGTAS